MKHFITFISIIILSTVSINTYAQLNGVPSEDYAGYKTVWKLMDGCIRYMDDGTYVLLGPTNNKFEKTMASIVLGDSKESAILTLEDLRKIVMKETEFPKSGLVVKGYGNAATTIYKSQGSFAFKTEYIAGETWILYHMKNKFDKAKEAIANFQE